MSSRCTLTNISRRAYHVGSGRPPFTYVPQSNIAGLPGLFGSAAHAWGPSNAVTRKAAPSNRTAWNVDSKLRLQRAIQDAPAADDVSAAVVRALLLAAALARQHRVVTAARVSAHREHRAERGRFARIEWQNGANLHARE